MGEEDLPRVWPQRLCSFWGRSDLGLGHWAEREKDTEGSHSQGVISLEGPQGPPHLRQKDSNTTSVPKSQRGNEHRETGEEGFRRPKQERRELLLAQALLANLGKLWLGNQSAVLVSASLGAF